MDCLKLLIKTFVFVVLKVALLLLLIDLALEVPLAIAHLLDRPLFRLYVTLSLLAALHSGLEFEILFLEAA